MSQREIGAHSGRSQAEISRLLHFHGAGPRARQLRARRRELVKLLSDAGLDNVRVFGSVATGTDRDGSDVDLLATPRRPVGLLALARLERDASRTVGMPVDLVLDDAIRPDLRERILDEAVPL
nr:nucleotidyltransferase domain-containing protein [Tessaracoccus sp. OS52]